MKKQIYIVIFIAIYLTSCHNNIDIANSAKIDGKYGFIDLTGEWVIRPSFDSVGTFYNDYADYYSNGKNGIINKEGKIIVEPIYDFVGHFINNRALVLERNKVNFINLGGNKISSRSFEDGDDFSNGLAAIQFEKDGKWGYIDTTGKLSIDTIFDYGSEFNNGIAEVEKGELTLQIDLAGNITDTIIEYHKPKSYKLIGSSKSGTLGRLSEKGDTIMQPKYISFGYEQDGIIWYNQDGSYGLADIQGNILIEAKYQYLSYFSDNGLALAKVNDKYGYIDKQGNTVVEFKFDEAKGFKYDLAAVKLDGKWGFISKDNEFIIEPVFENVGNHFRNFSAKYDPMYIYKKE